MNRRYDIFVVILIVVAFSGYGIYTAGIGPFDDDPGVKSVTVTDRGWRGDLPQVYGSYEGSGDNETYTGVINTASPAATLSANLSQISRNNTRFNSYAINIKTHNKSGGSRSCRGEVAYRIVSNIPEGSVGSRVATLYNGYLAGCDVSITGNASANVGCYQYFRNHGLADNRSVGSPASFWVTALPVEPTSRIIAQSTVEPFAIFPESTVVGKQRTIPVKPVSVLDAST